MDRGPLMEILAVVATSLSSKDRKIMVTVQHQEERIVVPQDILRFERPRLLFGLRKYFQSLCVAPCRRLYRTRLRKMHAFPNGQEFSR